jgi:integral membrane sensor domain MASE1
MIKTFLFTGARMLLVFSACVFSGYISWVLRNSGFGDSTSHVAPVFGVAIASVLIGGYRYLPAVFVGALLPSIFTENGMISIVSVPVAVVFFLLCPPAGCSLFSR